MATVDPHEGEAVFSSETDPALSPVAEHRALHAAKVKDVKDGKAAAKAKRKTAKRADPDTTDKRTDSDTAKRADPGTSDGASVAVGRGSGSVPSTTATGASTSAGVVAR